jgi:hypothetical protein
MFHKKLSLFVVLSAICALVFAAPASPAAASQVKTGSSTFTGTEFFISFISPGTQTFPAPGTMHLDKQIIINGKISSDPRFTGINTIVVNADFDLTTGEGQAKGIFLIEPGELKSVMTGTDPCAGKKTFLQRCFQQYGVTGMWWIFTPKVMGAWAGTFTSSLGAFGANPHSSTAVGYGIGKYMGLKVNASSTGYDYSGVVTEVHK